MRFLKIIPLLFFLCFFAEVRGQASNKIAQIATLPVGATTVRINAPSSQIEVFKTKGTRISIETAVQIKIGTLSLLDYLFKSGRYKMTILANGQLNMLTLSPSINNNVLLVKGTECEEIITYKIYIPERVKYIETLNANKGDFIPHQ